MILASEETFGRLFTGPPPASAYMTGAVQVRADRKAALDHLTLVQEAWVANAAEASVSGARGAVPTRALTPQATRGVSARVGTAPLAPDTEASAAFATHRLLDERQEVEGGVAIAPHLDGARHVGTGRVELAGEQAPERLLRCEDHAVCAAFTRRDGESAATGLDEPRANALHAKEV